MVINPFLGESLAWNVLSLSGLVNSSHELVEFMILVEIVPQGFSVGGVIATTETLLATVIEEGNTSGSQSEQQSTLEESPVSVSVKESSVIMVVDKDS